MNIMTYLTIHFFIKHSIGFGKINGGGNIEMFKCVMKKMSRSFNVKLREISRVTNFQREISKD